MDEARAMLDQLMGKARDLSDTQKDTMHQIHFYDDQVCKYYICGLCPYIAFFGTKSDMGKCPFPTCGLSLSTSPSRPLLGLSPHIC
jgi:hypothetical protein